MSGAPLDSAAREPAAMSVRGAAAWAIAGQYLSFAIQFTASIVISRLFLSPGEVGLFSIGLAAALLAAILQDFGLSRYVSGLATIDAAAIARCSSVALLFSLVVAGAIAAAAWPMARAYHQPALLPMMLIIAASYLLMPLAVVPLALMGRRMAFHGHFAVNVGGAAAQAAVAVTLAALGFSSFALAWGTLASGAARGLIAQVLRPALPWPLRLDRIRPIVGSGSRLSTLYLTGALGTRTPDLIVGKLLGVVAVGLYSRAVSLSDQFRMLISGAIGSVFFPAFARIRDRGEPLGPAYLRVAAGYSAVIWPGMAGLALAAAPIVRLLYGPAWAGVAQPLQLIALTELMLVALPLHIDLPILLGRVDRLLAVNVIDTLLSVTLLAVGCHWGIAGAAASRLLYGVAWLGLYAGFLYRLVGFDPRALLAIYARSALATVAALAPLAATYSFIAGPAAIGPGQLAASAAFGAGAWVATLALTRHPAAAELVGLARDGLAAFIRPRHGGAEADPVV